MEEVLKVLDSSLSSMTWRLRSSARLRLEIDILALCTGMRPVIMIDYGGKMPLLQHHLCQLVYLCQKESPAFEHLRVMIIEEMIYLVHVKELAEYASSSLTSEADLQFVDLEKDPPKMITLSEESSVGMELISVQKLFSSCFPLDGMNNNAVLNNRKDETANAESSGEHTSSQSSEVLDLSSSLHDSQITVPTLNGWLLGYPVVYLFSKEHIDDAVYNLSTKYLHIFRILIHRNGALKGSSPEELMRNCRCPEPVVIDKLLALVCMLSVRTVKRNICKLRNLLTLKSFTVPYDLSMGGSKEPWAEMFLSKLQSKWGKCKQTWRTLQMEVSECFPQAIAL